MLPPQTPAGPTPVRMGARVPIWAMATGVTAFFPTTAQTVKSTLVCALQVWILTKKSSFFYLFLNDILYSELCWLQPYIVGIGDMYKTR